VRGRIGRRWRIWGRRTMLADCRTIKKAACRWASRRGHSLTEAQRLFRGAPKSWDGPRIWAGIRVGVNQTPFSTLPGQVVKETGPSFQSVSGWGLRGVGWAGIGGAGRHRENPKEDAFGVEESDVQWDKSALHPKRDGVGVLPDENHPVQVAHRPNFHQPPPLEIGGVGQGQHEGLSVQAGGDDLKPRYISGVRCRRWGGEGSGARGGGGAGRRSGGRDGVGHRGGGHGGRGFRHPHGGAGRGVVTRVGDRELGAGPGQEGKGDYKE